MFEGIKNYLGTFEVESIHKEGYALEQFEGLDDFEVKTLG